MEKKGTDKKPNAHGIGLLWFGVHFAIEVICFQYYYSFFRSLALAWGVALFFDIFAFLPQYFFGALVERFPRISFGKIAVLAILLGACGGFVPVLRVPGIIVMSVGNGLLHVSAAEATLYTCEDKLGPSALFVAGGSFGVVAGRLLGTNDVHLLVGILVFAGGAVLVAISDLVRRGIARKDPHFAMASEKRSVMQIVTLAFFVVTIRGLIGYGIPTAWRKTTAQTVYLFVVMGLGKALGGLLSDRLGAKKVAMISTILSLPLLLLGEERMIVSLLGVMLFSMTMATTLGVLVSALPGHPLMAYGITTTGLLVGSVPVFFPPFRAFVSKPAILSGLTLLAICAIWIMMRPDKRTTGREERS